ncbi:hypothetical protein [Streptomyces sp. KL116D]|uniref:hypothetical protein n=1 Tax=Streptomyces sp. KL116D TaxID=3045152 RepID=UPI0035588CC0
MATPDVLVVTVALVPPPENVAFVSPTIANRTWTEPTPAPDLFFARTLTRSAKVSPAVAESVPVPARRRAR